MAVSETSHNKDGDVSTVVFSVTGDGNATTARDVIGHLTQFTYNQTGGTDSMAVTLTDTSSGMVMFSGGSVNSDKKPDDFKGGGGGFCRGPLKLTISGHSLDTEITVYYTRM